MRDKMLVPSLEMRDDAIPTKATVLKFDATSKMAFIFFKGWVYQAKSQDDSLAFGDSVSVVEHPRNSYWVRKEGKSWYAEPLKNWSNHAHKAQAALEYFLRKNKKWSPFEIFIDGTNTPTLIEIPFGPHQGGKGGGDFYQQYGGGTPGGGTGMGPGWTTGGVGGGIPGGIGEDGMNTTDIGGGIIIKSNGYDSGGHTAIITGEDLGNGNIRINFGSGTSAMAYYMYYTADPSITGVPADGPYNLTITIGGVTGSFSRNHLRTGLGYMDVPKSYAQRRLYVVRSILDYQDYGPVAYSNQYPVPGSGIGDVTKVAIWGEPVPLAAVMIPAGL